MMNTDLGRYFTGWADTTGPDVTRAMHQRRTGQAPSRAGAPLDKHKRQGETLRRRIYAPVAESLGMSLDEYIGNRATGHQWCAGHGEWRDASEFCAADRAALKTVRCRTCLQAEKATTQKPFRLETVTRAEHITPDVQLLVDELLSVAEYSELVRRMIETRGRQRKGREANPEHVTLTLLASQRNLHLAWYGAEVGEARFHRRLLEMLGDVPDSIKGESGATPTAKQGCGC